MRVEIKKIIHMDNPKCQIYESPSKGMICLDSGTAGKVTVNYEDLKSAIVQFDTWIESDPDA